MGRWVQPWAALTVLLLGDLVASGDVGAGDLQLHIICFNFETVQVTWDWSQHGRTNLTFLYKYETDEAFSPCTKYILRHGHTSGCVLGAERKVLYFSIRNETSPLLTMSRLVSDFLKPGPPKDVKFLWRQEAVTVACSHLAYGGLLYEVQHRSPFDTEWQSQEEKTCNVTIEGLDAEKCYYFRARVKTRESIYGPETYPSDWSEVTHWQRAELRGGTCHMAKLHNSCQEKEKPPPVKFPKFILISILVTLLMVGLLLLSLWKLERVKKFLVPCVPDPKCTFHGLFENHQGNFQDWIADTQNVVPLTKTECGDHECSIEEALVVHLPKTEAEPPSRTDWAVEEEDPGDGSLQLPHPAPRGGDVVLLGGFTFVMTDDTYIIL